MVTLPTHPQIMEKQLKTFVVALVPVFALSACAAGSSTSKPAAAAPASESKSEPVADASSSPDATGEKKDDLGLKCTTMAVTGTRIRRKVCTTAAQREQQRQQARRMMEGRSGSGTAPATGAGGP